MTVRRNVMEKAFGGFWDPLSKITTGSGAPIHATTRVGILYWDTVGENAYICTAIVGTWVKINA